MRRPLAHLSVAALTLGLLTIIPDAAGAAPPPDTDTYRMLTYNTQLRSWPADDEGIYGVSNEKRASAIADKILAGNAGGEYDIVALNEVFDDGGTILNPGSSRAVLFNKLLSQFPFVVQKLDDTELDTPEDSGLMLFSRFPFVSMNNTGQDCYLLDANFQCVIAFHAFDSPAVGADQLAAKGIGFVRIQNPHSDRPTDVYFTHMQAGEDAKAQTVRANQVSEAVSFINSWSGTSSPADVIVTGDLNVTAGTAEWASLMVSVNGFAGLGLFDTWSRHMPSSDPGFSSDPSRNAAAGGDDSTMGKRLDYLLFRGASSATTGVRACIQHLTLERHFKRQFTVDGSPVVIDLSDHFGLAASIGKAAAQCTPVSTLPSPPAEGALANPADGWRWQNLQWRGGFQWFRYSTPGTYSFAVNHPQQKNMVLDVFDATDLSTPLTPFTGSNVLVTPPCVAGCPPSPPVVVDATGPFYVRVRMQDPTVTGPYKYYSHLHRGASFADAIVLAPFENLFQLQMSNQTVNPMTTVHYAFKQRALFSGAQQKLAFNTTGHPNTALRIKVFDADKNPFPFMESDPKPGSQTLTTPAASPISAAEQKMFFTVDRLGCLNGCPLGTYTVNWTTDYRNLDVRKFWVKDQNDVPEWTENDEVTCMIGIDSVGTFPVIFGTMDEGGARYFPAPFRDIGFTSAVTAKCIEADGNVHDTTITQGVTSGDIDATDPLDKTLKYMLFNDGGGEGTDGLYRIAVTGRRMIQP